MAVITKTKTIQPGRLKALHTTVGKRFSVEILDGRDTVALSMNRILFEDPNFADVSLLILTIPFATVRASVQPGLPATTIRYRVRSGRDFTGTPEIREGLRPAA